jgi:uncharacterized protein with ParB-like and HNH nuclease domain
VKAEGLTPGQVLQNPQRLLVPLFQRPYVWGLESQWEPLWNDITRMAEGLLKNFSNPPKPHFLGAVVLQHHQGSLASLSQRIVIDGQQRLTTLQIMIDAVQAEMERANQQSPASRLRDLIENEAKYRRSEDDRFKLWPTNKDRDAYREVMGAAPPIDYSTLKYREERIPQAHKYFAEKANEFLHEDGLDNVSLRADALEVALRSLLKVVVIDLDPDEDAQEIFETLNSRGVKLTAADLIKNYIFQQLENTNENSDEAYEKYWKRFETAFWEEEINSGRLSYPRAAIFLNHFLISRTGEVITAAEVFFRFKKYASEDSGLSTLELLKQIHEAAVIYENHIVLANSANNDLGPIELFLYRCQTMDFEIVKSLVVYLLDPSLPKISHDVVVRSLSHIESWLVRRAIVRTSTKAFNRIMAQLISELLKINRNDVDIFIEEFLAKQTSDSSYWPDDAHVREVLRHSRLYKTLPRNRVRMILEALEDDSRGFGREFSGMGEQRCPRGVLTIEHVLPQKWVDNWPLNPGESEDGRNKKVHVLGNLTLLTSKLNSKVSNGAWLGDDGKLASLNNQSSLLLNAQIQNMGKDNWNDQIIDQRNEALINRILSIWSVPQGHKVELNVVPVSSTSYVSISDLMNADFLKSGDVLRSRRKSFENRYAVVLDNGSLEIDDGEIFDTLSGAASYLRNNNTAGWHFWKLESNGLMLATIREQYRARFGLIQEETDDDDDDDASSEDSVVIGAETRGIAAKYVVIWSSYLAKMNQLHPEWSNIRAANAANWQKVENVKGGACRFVLVIDKDRIPRIELFILAREVSETLQIFRTLKSKKDVIEERFGSKLVWDEQEDLLCRRIWIQRQNPVDLEDESTFEELVDWFYGEHEKFRSAIYPELVAN